MVEIPCLERVGDGEAGLEEGLGEEEERGTGELQKLIFFYKN